MLVSITLVNPYGGHGIIPCQITPPIFTCDFGLCLQGNFTIPQYDLILRDYQKPSLGVISLTVMVDSTVSPSVVTVDPSTVTIQPTPLCPSISMTSALMTPSTVLCLSPSEQTAQIGSINSKNALKMIGVGIGVGVPFGIAIIISTALLVRQRRTTRSVLQQQEQHIHTLHTLSSSTMSKNTSYVPTLDGADSQARNELENTRAVYEVVGDNGI